MEEQEYQNIFQNEETHFFYVGLHSLVTRWARRYSGKTKNILDAGCGTGLLAKKLETLGRVWGVDVHDEARRFARRRGIRVVKASITALPFAANQFGLITCIDVLYHQSVESDGAALREFYRVLRPGGVLILRVPANNWLRLVHDRYVHTRHRYSKGELSRKLTTPGFVIEKISYSNMFLLPAYLGRFIWECVRRPQARASAIKRPPSIVNEILLWLLIVEGRLLDFINLPWGIGLFAVCRKPRRQQGRPSMVS